MAEVLWALWESPKCEICLLTVKCHGNSSMCQVETWWYAASAAALETHETTHPSLISTSFLFYLPPVWDLSEKPTESSSCSDNFPKKSTGHFWTRYHLPPQALWAAHCDCCDVPASDGSGMRHRRFSGLGAFWHVSWPGDSRHELLSVCVWVSACPDLSGTPCEGSCL